MSDYVRLSGNSKNLNSTNSNAYNPNMAKEITSLWKELEGTWVGNSGFNMISVPSKEKINNKIVDSFKILPIPYAEELNFSIPGGPARNRGQDLDQFVAALEYHQRVWNKESNELMHVENGMYLNLADIRFHKDYVPVSIPNDKTYEFNIARTGSIPHGDSIMLLGKFQKDSPLIKQKVFSKDLGLPNCEPVDINVSIMIPDIPQPLKGPNSLPKNTGKARRGYGEEFFLPENNTEKPYKKEKPIRHYSYPNQYLIDALEKQGLVLTEDGKPRYTINSVKKLEFNSKFGGKITNIPYINQNAKATDMQATFWIETVKDHLTGQTFSQLQYSQVINIAFLRPFPDKNGDRPSGLISWPHITVNTLVKQ